jgi:diadenosine tetraphosphate (Ap4A) HIT family hydrolase
MDLSEPIVAYTCVNIKHRFGAEYASRIKSIVQIIMGQAVSRLHWHIIRTEPAMNICIYS